MSTPDYPEVRPRSEWEQALIELTAPVVPLWTGLAPHSRGPGPDDTPRLYLYLPKRTAKPAPAVLLLPGGGYEALMYEHEGHNEAEWFVRQGVAAFLLLYRLPSFGYRHPVPLLDAARAVRLMRFRARDWNLDQQKIAVMGFSAGGHLATTLATHFDLGDAAANDPVERESSRPDFVLPIYPVVTLKVPGVTHEGSKLNLLGPNPDPQLVNNLSNETQVTQTTPPTLLVHSTEDTAVPIENSRLFGEALKAKSVVSELHEYPTGGHGFGFSPQGSAQPVDWLSRCLDWLRRHGF